MARMLIGRREGRWFVEAGGCCSPAAVRREYDRAHAVQVLREGGRLAEWDQRRFVIVDRKGHLHRY
jgi:hypothetical protein